MKTPQENKKSSNKNYIVGAGDDTTHNKRVNAVVIEEKKLEKFRKIQKDIKKKTGIEIEKSLYSKTTVLEPVLINNELKYLVVKTMNKAPESRYEMELMLRGEIDADKVVTFDLIDPGLWQCNKCGAQTQSNNGAPIYCTGCKRNSSFTQLTEPINKDLWKIPKWKDIGDLNMIEVYDDLVRLLKCCLVLPEEIHYRILALWIISTWKTGRWRTVGFLVFLGDRDTGKTTALDIIRETGYRMIHAAGTTFPAMVRATHYYHAGVLVDEASDRLDGKTETGREMLNFIKPSYRIGSKYTAADKEDQKRIRSYNNFGFKVFAGERSFTLSFLSRSIVFIMEHNYPEVPSLEYVLDELDDLQTKLLIYRYKFNQPPDLGEDFILKGRTREIFESIIATGKHIGVNVNDIIKYAQDLEKEKEEALIGTVEWEILNAIKGQEENERLFDAPEEISFKDICLSLGWDYDGKTAQRLGYIFNKKLLLKTKRKTHCTVLLLNEPKNDRRLKYLYRRYKV